jgi:hypothetical protein
MKKSLVARDERQDCEIYPILSRVPKILSAKISVLWTIAAGRVGLYTMVIHCNGFHHGSRSE